jgi:hypothetical protein
MNLAYGFRHKTYTSRTLSFADAFALALVERLNIPLVTTDHHEFDAIERKGHFRFMLRQGMEKAAQRTPGQLSGSWRSRSEPTP